VLRNSYLSSYWHKINNCFNSICREKSNGRLETKVEMGDNIKIGLGVITLTGLTGC
jgi:hypothetical protein